AVTWLRGGYAGARVRGLVARFHPATSQPRNPATPRPRTRAPTHPEARAMSRKLTYDTWLFGAAMLIVVIGLVMIYSASAIITLQKVGADKPYYFMTRQCIWLIVGGSVMMLLMHLDTRLLQHPRVIAV